MDFLKLAEDRFSVRKFADKSVEEEKIRKIVRAGQVAPTACNLQPQKILVIQSDEAIQKYKRCTKCHFDAKLAILTCYDKSLCWQRKYDGKISGEIDASIVTTHMMLEAADLGIGSTWVMYFDPQKVCEEFKLPENYVPVSLLAMGYPADDAKPYPGHSEIKNIEETVSFNKF